MKIRSLMLALVAVLALALTACSAASGTEIKSGAQKMQAILTDVKSAVEAKDAAKATTEAEEMHEAWEKFEDAVKAKDKDLYEKIEEPLGAIRAGVKVSPLDQKVLTEQIAKLDGLLAGLVK